MSLLALIFIPLAFALLIPACKESWAKWIALFGTLSCALVFLAPWTEFDAATGAAWQFDLNTPWIAKLGLNIHLGADAVSLLLIGLTCLLGPVCVGCSWTAITDRSKTFYAWLLILQAATVGVFSARDIILFYICFEFTLIPMFVLISIYGSTNRARAAIKFFLYTFTGSLITLAGVIYVAWRHAELNGTWSFDILELAQTARGLPSETQAWVLGAILAGFAVKVPLFPFHTWLPLAHTEAPTAGSVILAGTLLKLGTYGLYRFALPFAPLAVVEYAPYIAGICVIGILYGGLICWVQRDVKKLVAYSSVAHLGFCVLGLVAMNQTGLTGAVLYMVNHGLSTGALFVLIGMIYERFHTRSMRELGGLAARMPIWATFMVFFAMASVGLPGLNGFVSEVLCLMGAFQASDAWSSDAGVWGSAGAAVPGATGGGLGPVVALLAGLGMIIAAIYLLYMVGSVVFGPLVLPKGHEDGHKAHGGHDDTSHAAAHTAAHAAHGGLPRDLTWREIGVLVPLAVFCVWLGVYPKYFTDRLEVAINAQTELMAEAIDEVRFERSLGAAKTPEASTLATEKGEIFTPEQEAGFREFLERSRAKLEAETAGKPRLTSHRETTQQKLEQWYATEEALSRLSIFDEEPWWPARSGFTAKERDSYMKRLDRARVTLAAEAVTRPTDQEAAR
jgi:NADH-quinone oxidoreductase subunit M